MNDDIDVQLKKMEELGNDINESTPVTSLMSHVKVRQY